MPERKSLAQEKVVSLDFGDRQPVVRVHLLGALQATSALGEPILPRGRKSRALFGYLCLHAGQRVSRSRIAALLWDRVPDEQARTSLRQALRDLTRAMGPLARELITADLDSVKLEARCCWIDALAMLSCDKRPSHAFQGELAFLCPGDLLEDFDGLTAAFDQWLLTERTRFSAQLRHLFDKELQQLSQANTSAEQSAALARRIIAFDATHEGASRVLMRALADKGERAQALREYERCRAALRMALDVEPSPETRGLYQALRTFAGPAKPAEAQPAAEPPPAGKRPAPSARLSGRLRVGVLPFQGHSPPAEKLAFSLSQEIASALARFRWFDVIAPVALKPASAGHLSHLQKQHWQYSVDGTLTQSGDRFCISVRLLDLSQEARPVWSDRFELAGDALGDVHERVIAPVVARIDPVILFIEGQPKRPKLSGASGFVLQAIPLMYSLERSNYEEAGQLIDQAMQADPDNAMAAAWGAYWQVWYTGQGWAKDPLEAFAKAQELALRAIRIDPDNAEALGLYAHICAFLNKDFESALHYLDRALRLNPNLAFIWALSAATYCYVGQPDRALQHLDRYRGLAPFDPYFHFWEGIYTIAYLFKGDYRQAARVGRRAVKANPNFSNYYKPLIAALGHLGQRDDAAPYIQKLLALEPSFTIESFGKVYPFQRPEDRERYMRGLELAGVPLA